MEIVIPASNEAGWIGGCLDALLASEAGPAPVRILVAANGCRDDTAAIARTRTGAAAARGWTLEVLEIEKGGKINALNRADAALGPVAGARAYLDADVTVEPALLGELARLLDLGEPAYASGRLHVARAETAVTRAYARIWTRLPFMTEGVPGAGLFAVNAAGRARWAAFPEIISDDTYVRLLFTPEERFSAEAGYLWPMAEGFQRLVRVRRRQDAGVDEIRAQFPALMANEGKAALTPATLARLALSDPPGFAVYAAVAVAVRATRRRAQDWSRGR